MENLTYSTYLRLNEILSNQILQSNNAHDEMLFIIVHQTYELWFKQIIHDANAITLNIENNELFSILHKLRRIGAIIKLIISQINILETMHPDSFASFRKHLGSSSGFQSEQFRIIELTFGISKNPEIKNFNELENKNDIWGAFLKNCITNIQINKKFLEKFNEVEALLLSIYFNKSLYTEIVEIFLDLDEGIQEWRYRHLKLVERIIGSKIIGTGGSEGFNYLIKTLEKSFCKELWSIRNIINNVEFYNFCTQDQITSDCYS
jgi:tryptophan 2,3-dioxygenase